MAADLGATTALPDDVKKNLKSIVLELRHLFEADLGLGLRRLGIDAETGRVTPADDPALSYLTAEEREVRNSLDAVLAKEAAMTKDVPEAVRALLREAAYTHLNRLIGLKCLELRRHLVIDGERTEVVTQRRDYGDLSKYLWTLRSKDARLLGDPELLWREGLLRACAAASAELGVLFDPEDPYAHVWPSHRAVVQAVRTLDELPESAFRADEFLGWVYQYFQSEEKVRVFDEVKTKKKKKIAWSDIVPVTQLYTERYMVDFLLQNSIGARWMEMYPDSRAKEAWPYYVEPASPHEREHQAVKEWTILDPCCGSGHFLVVAFDLLTQLYAEERALAEQGLIPADWAMPEVDVARTILERNLHGIDIDPRAVQLSALALYLKAKELGLRGTPQMHLVIADCVLQRGEQFQGLLDAYKDDRAASKAIEAIWDALEHVRDLGSLVRIEEEVEAAVVEARKWSAGSFDDLARDWDTYRAQLIARLKSAFSAEALSRDERERVFGAEAGKGLDLFGLLGARYDVVCTNPPYMGSGNIGPIAKQYLSRHYSAGRKDLFASFILRCIELCRQGGYSAMVTQRGWLFLSSYADLRNGVASSRSAASAGFRGVLKETGIRVLAQLGPHAFTEVSGAVVNVVLFSLVRESVGDDERSRSIRIPDHFGAAEKAAALRRNAEVGAHPQLSVFSQRAFLEIAGSPILYWFSPFMLSRFRELAALGDRFEIREGPCTGNDARWLRFRWEVAVESEWVPFPKGGGYCKWFGLDHYRIRWGDDGSQLKKFSGSIVPNEKYYFREGLTYTEAADGAFGVRLLPSTHIPGNKAPGLYPMADNLGVASCLLNCRLVSYFARSLSTSIDFGVGPLRTVPMPTPDATVAARLEPLGLTCVHAKRELRSSDPIESAFRLERASVAGNPETDSLAAWMHAIEGQIERVVFAQYEVRDRETEPVLNTVGVPSGWHPLLVGYDSLPSIPHGFPELPAEVFGQHAQHERLELSSDDLKYLKSRLRSLYVAGPGAKAEDEETEAPQAGEDDAAVGAHIPIPPETFLEELSQRLKLHPISVFWLLEELRGREGLVCPSETKREAEDWLSVKLLRMLGQRWPMQDQYEEEGDRLLLDPAWVDADGIIAFTSGMGEETLSERVRGFLDAEFGPDRGHEVELELVHALGWKPGKEWGKQKPLSLGDWFQRDFFRRHVSQFKRRPVAWHLKSPKGTVQAIVHYHAFNRDRLALLRARYLGNLRQELMGKLSVAAARGYEDRSNLASIEEFEEQLADLEAFDAKLAYLQEGRDREARIWCPWKAPAVQPQGWDPDINDGVRVNIAPLQRLGLLAADVLNKKDLNSLLAPEGRG